MSHELPKFVLKGRRAVAHGSVSTHSMADGKPIAVEMLTVGGQACGDSAKRSSYAERCTRLSVNSVPIKAGPRT